MKNQVKRLLAACLSSVLLVSGIGATLLLGTQNVEAATPSAYTGDKVTIKSSGIDINFYPGWVRKAATFSFDDGFYNEWYYSKTYLGGKKGGEDLPKRPIIAMSGSTEAKLLAMMEKYGVKGTFNLVSKWALQSHGDSEAAFQEIRNYYANQEVGSHSRVHDNMAMTAVAGMGDYDEMEVNASTQKLTQIMGYKPRIFAWPYKGITKSSFPAVWSALSQNGYLMTRNADSAVYPDSPDSVINKYAFNAQISDSDYTLLRTFVPTGNTPALATPNCAISDKFLTWPDDGKLKLWYTWGHSFDYVEDEFGVGLGSQNYGRGYPVTNTEKFAELEAFCKKLGADDSIWKATNSEIISYLRGLARVYVYGRTVDNTSGNTIYITVDGVRKTQAPYTKVVY